IAFLFFTNTLHSHFSHSLAHSLSSSSHSCPHSAYIPSLSSHSHSLLHSPSEQLHPPPTRYSYSFPRRVLLRYYARLQGTFPHHPILTPHQHCNWSLLSPPFSARQQRPSRQLSYQSIHRY